jgi:hypothetical protein
MKQARMKKAVASKTKLDLQFRQQLTATATLAQSLVLCR